MTGPRARRRARSAVECLVAEGSAVAARENSWRSRKASPPPQSRIAFTLSKNVNHSSSEAANFSCEGQITKETAFDLEVQQ